MAADGRGWARWDSSGEVSDTPVLQILISPSPYFSTASSAGPPEVVHVASKEKRTVKKACAELGL